MNTVTQSETLALSAVAAAAAWCPDAPSPTMLAVGARNDSGSPKGRSTCREHHWARTPMSGPAPMRWGISLTAWVVGNGHPIGCQGCADALKRWQRCPGHASSRNRITPTAAL